jgi:hypothetical protein
VPALGAAIHSAREIGQALAAGELQRGPDGRSEQRADAGRACGRSGHRAVRGAHPTNADFLAGRAAMVFRVEAVQPRLEKAVLQRDDAQSTIEAALAAARDA